MGTEIKGPIFLGRLDFLGTLQIIGKPKTLQFREGQQIQKFVLSLKVVCSIVWKLTEVTLTLLYLANIRKSSEIVKTTPY